MYVHMYCTYVLFSMHFLIGEPQGRVGGSLCMCGERGEVVVYWFRSFLFLFFFSVKIVMMDI